MKSLERLRCNNWVEMEQSNQWGMIGYDFEKKYGYVGNKIKIFAAWKTTWMHFFRMAKNEC